MSWQQVLHKVVFGTKTGSGGGSGVRTLRRLRLESLENRELLSATATADVIAAPQLFDPSHEEQELLERINFMRMYPQEELARLFSISNISTIKARDPRVQSAIDHAKVQAAELLAQWDTLSPAAPIAWSSSLCAAADTHNDLMIANDSQKHQFAGESSLFDRFLAAGFDPSFSGVGSSSFSSVAENIFAYGYSANDNFTAASFTHSAFAIDWGVPNYEHRTNIMNPEFTDVGISMTYENNLYTAVGSWITTVDFATGNTALQTSGGYLVGVVYNDKNGSGYYEAREGIANVTVSVRRLDGSDDFYSTTTWTAGGYQILLEDGLYEVIVVDSGFSRPVTKTVLVEGQNVKVDFRVQDISSQPPVVKLSGTASSEKNYTATYLEGDGPTWIVSSQMTVRDTDSRYLTVAEIAMMDRYDGAKEILSVDTTGTTLTASYDSLTGVLTVSGRGTVEEYQTVLRTLSYFNLNPLPDLAERSVSVKVSDGVQFSDEAVCTIEIQQRSQPNVTVSDAKVVEGDSGGDEKGQPVFLEFTVELDSPLRTEMTLTYDVVAGSAILGEDFGIPDNTVFSLAAGQTKGVIRIPIFGNFAEQEDRDLRLTNFDVTGATLLSNWATGTIVDDDKIIDLGSRQGWMELRVDLTEARKLYSFTPTADSQLVWDALGPDDTRGVTLFLYRDNHSGAALTQSYQINDRKSFIFDVKQGETYIVKVVGDCVLEYLKMTLAVSTPSSLSLDYNSADGGEINFQFGDGDVNVSVPGSGPLRYLDSDYLPNVSFEDTNPSDPPPQPEDPDDPVAPRPTSLAIEAGQIWVDLSQNVVWVLHQGLSETDVFSNMFSTPFTSGTLNRIMDWDMAEYEGLVTRFDISSFSRITLTGRQTTSQTEEEPLRSTIRLVGTTGSDSFQWNQYSGEYRTATGLTLKLSNFEHIQVDGNLGNNATILVSTPASDRFLFGSVAVASAPDSSETTTSRVGYVEMVNGTFRLEMWGFFTASAVSRYWGNDELVILGGNGSQIVLSDMTAVLTERTTSGITMIYRGMYFKNTLTVDYDLEAPSTVIFGGNQIYGDDVRISQSEGTTVITTVLNRFRHQIVGYSNITDTSGLPLQPTAIAAMMAASWSPLYDSDYDERIGHHEFADVLDILEDVVLADTLSFSTASSSTDITETRKRNDTIGVFDELFRTLEDMD